MHIAMKSGAWLPSVVYGKHWNACDNNAYLVIEVAEIQYKYKKCK